MLTNNDLKLIRQAIKEEVTEQNEQLHQQLRSDTAQFKDDILTEIVKLREDVTVITGYKDQLEDHESRLETIETKLDIAI